MNRKGKVRRLRAMPAIQFSAPGIKCRLSRQRRGNGRGAFDALALETVTPEGRQVDFVTPEGLRLILDNAERVRALMDGIGDCEAPVINEYETINENLREWLAEVYKD